MTPNNKPSVKTLLAITESKDDAKLLRKVLLCSTQDAAFELMDAVPERFKSSDQWLRSCFHLPMLQDIKLSMANEVMRGYGVEHVQGKGTYRTASFDYVNMGDPYVATLVYHHGRYKVCCWGDIVEKGNYD